MAAKATTPRKTAPKPEQVEASDEVTSEAETFTWKPKGGGADIVLPHALAAIPKGKVLRFFYQMNKRKGDTVAQITYALTAAGVSEAVQDRVFELDDDEAVDLVTAWAAVITGATPGES